MGIRDFIRKLMDAKQDDLADANVEALRSSTKVGPLRRLMVQHQLKEAAEAEQAIRDLAAIHEEKDDDE